MKTVIEMAQEAGFTSGELAFMEDNFLFFAELVRADEREQVAAWMMKGGYATGHGDTIEDLLQELEWQIRESEREACAKVCDELFADLPPYTAPDCAAAIRERGDDAP